MVESSPQQLAPRIHFCLSFTSSMLDFNLFSVFLLFLESLVKLQLNLESEIISWGTKNFKRKKCMNAGKAACGVNSIHLFNKHFVDSLELVQNTQSTEK